MPSIPNLNFINEIVKQYHTIDLQIKTGAEATSALKNEFAAMRIELLNLKAQVAALEESRNTLRAEMERVKAETVAKMEVLKAETLAKMESLKAETIAELRAVKAETVAELKVQQVRYEADLYHKLVDAQAAAKKDPVEVKTPQIEK